MLSFPRPPALGTCLHSHGDYNSEKIEGGDVSINPLISVILGPIGMTSLRRQRTDDMVEHFLLPSGHDFLRLFMRRWNKKRERCRVTYDLEETE